MEGIELVKYARTQATQGVDLFALLGVDATTPPDNIHKAWRRTALKYHPDKAGAAYDAALYDSLGRARDVLLDAEARAAYSGLVAAAMQKKAQRDTMDARRRRLLEELEISEAAARGDKRAKTQSPAETNPELKAQLERGRAKWEERKRLLREAEERDRLREVERQKKWEAENTGVSNLDNAPANTTPTTGPTPTDTSRTAAGVPKDSAKQTSTQASGTTEDLDKRIAYLEQAIRERKEKKARKLEKKMRKAEGGEGTDESGTAQAGATTDTEKLAAETAPAHDPKDSSQADAPLPRSVSPKPATADDSKPFASTMARLRAAQAKRDEEKRKRAEAEEKSQLAS